MWFNLPQYLWCESHRIPMKDERTHYTLSHLHFIHPFRWCYAKPMLLVITIRKDIKCPFLISFRLAFAHPFIASEDMFFFWVIISKYRTLWMNEWRKGMVYDCKYVIRTTRKKKENMKGLLRVVHIWIWIRIYDDNDDWMMIIGETR